MTKVMGQDGRSRARWLVSLDEIASFVAGGSMLEIEESDSLPRDADLTRSDEPQGADVVSHPRADFQARQTFHFAQCWDGDALHLSARRLLCGGNGCVYEFALPSGALTRTDVIDASSDVTVVTETPDGDLVVAATAARAVVGLRQGREVFRIAMPASRLNSLSVSADGRSVLAVLYSPSAEISAVRLLKT